MRGLPKVDHDDEHKVNNPERRPVFALVDITHETEFGKHDAENRHKRACHFAHMCTGEGDQKDAVSERTLLHTRTEARAEAVHDVTLHTRLPGLPHHPHRRESSGIPVFYTRTLTVIVCRVIPDVRGRDEEGKQMLRHHVPDLRLRSDFDKLGPAKGALHRTDLRWYGVTATRDRTNKTCNTTLLQNCRIYQNPHSMRQRRHCLYTKTYGDMLPFCDTHSLRLMRIYR